MSKVNEEIIEEAVESKYEMRGLKTSDIYVMSKILKKLNLKMNVDLNKYKGKKISQEDAGKEMMIDLLKTALENLSDAENEVNTFLASLVGLKAKEFSNLPIEDTFEIIGLFKEQKGLKNFLKQAGM